MTTCELEPAENINLLDERIKALYYEGKGYAEISVELGISHSRVHRRIGAMLKWGEITPQRPELCKARRNSRRGDA